MNMRDVRFLFGVLSGQIEILDDEVESVIVHDPRVGVHNDVFARQFAFEDDNGGFVFQMYLN